MSKFKPVREDTFDRRDKKVFTEKRVKSQGRNHYLKDLDQDDLDDDLDIPENTDDVNQTTRD